MKNGLLWMFCDIWGQVIEPMTGRIITSIPVLGGGTRVATQYPYTGACGLAGGPRWHLGRMVCCVRMRLWQGYAGWALRVVQMQISSTRPVHARPRSTHLRMLA
jgi:hypothetical protein